MSALGAVIGIAVALIIIAVLVYVVGKYKEPLKYKKGKIVYDCDSKPADPKNPKPEETVGTCVIKERKNNLPSKYSSMARCKPRCGTFYQCVNAGIEGNRCIKVSNNLGEQYVNSLQECEKNCNANNPAPIPGTVSSGTYVIKSSNNNDPAYKNGAFLISRYDCNTNQVYAVLDENATFETADRWTFSSSSGTIKTNKQYPATFDNCIGKVFPYASRDLYLSFSSTETNLGDDKRRLAVLAPLGSDMTTDWFLSIDPLSNGRIARKWELSSPYDYGCVDSYFPRLGPQQQQNYAQPFQFCRAIGFTGSYQFLPARK